MNQNNEVVSLRGTAGIISHLVVIGADQGPVDGADREGQQLVLFARTLGSSNTSYVVRAQCTYRLDVSAGAVRPLPPLVWLRSPQGPEVPYPRVRSTVT